MPQHVLLTNLLSIGDRIRYLMELRRIKQTELAALAGVTQPAISNLVTDSSRQPSAPTLLAIAEALRASPQWILDGVGDPEGWVAVMKTDEVRLIHLWRTLTQTQRDNLVALLQSMHEEPRS